MWGTGRLVGEVIGLTSERTTIEVYEETTGLKPGEPVAGTGAPVSATLAPGIGTSIFRRHLSGRLNAIQKESGCYTSTGASTRIPWIQKKKWHAHANQLKRRPPLSRRRHRRVPEARPFTHGHGAAGHGGFVLSVGRRWGITPSRSLW
ncbi:MAG: hypothetical protein ACLUD2_20550 [Clostridium sp.]